MTSASHSLPGAHGALHLRQPKICRDQNLRVPSQKNPPANSKKELFTLIPHPPPTMHLGMRETPPKLPEEHRSCCSCPCSLQRRQASLSLAGQSREPAPAAVACPCRVICAWSYLGWVLAEECVPMGQVFPGAVGCSAGERCCTFHCWNLHTGFYSSAALLFVFISPSLLFFHTCLCVMF